MRAFLLILSLAACGEPDDLGRYTPPQAMPEPEPPPAYAAVVTTTVCSSGAINVNGKPTRGGKSGCIRFYSDGTAERF